MTTSPSIFLTETECSVCQKSFSRPEHLRRHLATHTREKSYPCQFCDKTFARKDAASRHELAHVPDGSSKPDNGGLKVCHTCTECRHARIKCSGLEPCQHCAKKKLECRYVPRKDSKRRRSEIDDQSSHRKSKSSAPALTQALQGKENMQYEHSSLPSTIAGQDVNVNAQRGANTVSSALSNGLDMWSSQAILPTTGKNPIEPTVVNESEEGLTTSVTDTLWRWESPSAINWPATNTIHEDVATGGRNLLPNDPMVDILGNEINWLPFDNMSNLEIDVIGDPFADSTTFLPIQLPDDYPLPRMTVDTQNQTLEAFQNGRTHAQSSPATTEDVEMESSDFSTLHDVGNSPLRQTRTATAKRRLYVDGEGARSTRSGPAKPRRNSSRTTSRSPFTTSPLSAPSTMYPLHDLMNSQVQRERPHEGTPNSITSQAFEDIIFKLRTTSSIFSDPLHPFTAEYFPSVQTLDWCVNLYFEHFNIIYPFLDRSLFSVPDWGWYLSLATAAIGAQYMAFPGASACSDALHGLLHSIFTQDYDIDGKEESLIYVQARALNVIGLCHSHQKRLVDIGHKTIDIVSAASSRLGLLDEISSLHQQSEEDNLERSWISWRAKESRRRTGFFIWMLDCTIAYISNSSPRLSINSLTLSLPSPERLWQADTSQAWRNLGQVPELVPVQKALQTLYVERRLTAPVSDFASMIIIYAIVQRTRDVARYYEHSLSCWTPTASNDQQLQPEREPNRSYLATIPQFSRWRNSACDCLDVLHWEALGTSAKAGGLEGPIFLHLHLARSLLLTPVEELEVLVHAMGSQVRSCHLPHNYLPSHQSYMDCRRIIGIWVRRDKYKARLAVIHASATFWHVRRYSSNSFVQSFAVFLATIVLWAYGSFAAIPEKQHNHHLPTTMGSSYPNRQRKNALASQDHEEDGGAIERANNVSEPEIQRTAQSQPTRSSSPSTANSDSSPGIPDFMHIDRPIDDEIAQHFIRAGHAMKIFMAGVGELCSPSGPELVLREGARVLRNKGNATWAIAEGYAAVLEAAASAYQVTGESSIG